MYELEINSIGKMPSGPDKESNDVLLLSKFSLALCQSILITGFDFRDNLLLLLELQPQCLVPSLDGRKDDVGLLLDLLEPGFILRTSSSVSDKQWDMR
jgi:hypothetical protein